MRAILFLAFGLALAAGGNVPQRIIGGSETTIEQYPYAASVLLSPTGTGTFWQNCAGSIINNRSILSAASCFFGGSITHFRVRVGATEADSGGSVHTTSAITIHAYYNHQTVDNDIAILRIAGEFSFNNLVLPGTIPSAIYYLADNVPVWAIGWGWTSNQGPGSELLRHVQLLTVNQQICASRYAELARVVTNNMLCSGWLDVGGRDQCMGDSGGPLIHNGVIVGVSSWGRCGNSRYPGVNTRVSRYSYWIRSNA